MVIQLAEHLEVPLRDRNALLLAAGYAPAYAQRDLDEPEMGPVRDAIDRVLRGHEPFPAIVVDRHWGLVAQNRAVPLLIAGAAAHLLEPPVNVLRLSLHPEGMAPRIVNLGEWRAHLLERLARQVALTGDPQLRSLWEELLAYPAPAPAFAGTADIPPGGAVAVPLRVRATIGAEPVELAFISTVSTFGTAIDITAAELSIEAFYPADAATAEALRLPER
jgi:hypothetical protein